MTRRTKFIIFIVVFANILFACGQDDLYKSLVCAEKEDCMSCISAADFCYWCDDHPFIQSNRPACNSEENLRRDSCPPSSIVKGNKTYVYYNEDAPLIDMNSTHAANQMKPQKVTMGLKKGETHSVSFEYRLSKNYPLDLYYLMDLTWSMADDKETLVELKSDLPIALKDLTDRFRLGFGSFADKPLTPYANMDRRHTLNPCSTELGVCGPTYAFKHRLNLTDKVADFVHVVNTTGVTGNLDNLEATVEALMQVAVCGEKLGWHQDSRKIVILATDGMVHFAGMGKLGGVVKPNDEKCHTDNDGNYTESTAMDYPSLAQINRVLDEYKINVIFAVTEEVQKYYEQINELLPDHTYVGRLANDSSNILSLVKQGYEDFVSVINFDDDSEPPFRLTYFADCGNNGTVVETSKCEGVKIGETYNFTINITMDECPKDGHGKVQTIQIFDVQIGRKEMAIDIVPYCKCECKAPDLEFASSLCPEHSELVCGKCSCLSGWSGQNCDCNLLETGQNEKQLAEKCADPEGVTAGQVCSLSGDCLCGECQCDPGFTGTFCQYRVCGTNPVNGLECGGPEQGTCSRGECTCQADWSGPTCSCSTRTELCTLPGDSYLCSDRGECLCGECRCSRLENVYSGTFCETCTNCDNPMCQLYEECAVATVRGSSNASAICTTASNATVIPSLVRKDADAPPKAVFCISRKDEGDGTTCQYRFNYEVQQNWKVLLRAYPKTCDSIMQQAMFSLFLPAMVVLIVGIFTLCIWKIIEMRKEKMEFKKFEANEAKQMEAMGDQQENPLYKSPISNFEMPADFNRKRGSRGGTENP